MYYWRVIEEDSGEIIEMGRGFGSPEKALKNAVRYVTRGWDSHPLDADYLITIVEAPKEADEFSSGDKFNPAYRKVIWTFGDMVRILPITRKELLRLGRRLG
jgi:hypothetical protein